MLINLNIFKPIITSSQSYIKDSENLLQLYNKIQYNKMLKLHSCDFSNIDSKYINYNGNTM